MSLRELAITIGWVINDSVLRRADQLTDRYKQKVQDTEDAVEDLGAAVSALGGDFRRSSSLAERALQDIGSAADDVSVAIRGIPDPKVDGSEAVREIVRIEVAADELAQAIRSLPDPEIDASKAKRELESAKREAMDLKEVLGALGGGAAGAAIASDITSFAQLPREFQAQLGVTEEVARDLATTVEQLWSDVPNAAKESTYEAVALAHQFFGAVQKDAYELGRDLLLLSQQSQMEIAELARAANLIETRFRDVKSPQEALDILAAASQRLPRDVFEELIDNTEEYGGNIAAAGLTANDFFSAMIRGGQRSRYVMDRLGDVLSNELLPKIRIAEDATIDALTSLAGTFMGLENVTPDTIEEFEKLTEEIDKLKEKGKPIPTELTNRVKELQAAIIPATQQALEWREAILSGGEDGRKAMLELIGTLDDVAPAYRTTIGSTLFGAMYEEQERELLPIFDALGRGFDDLGGDIENLAIRSEGPLNELRRWLRNIRVELDELTGGTFGQASELVGAALPGVLGFVGAGWVSKLLKGEVKIGGKGGLFGKLTGGIGKLGGISRLTGIVGRAFWPVGLGLGALEIARAAPEARGATVGSVAGGLGGAAAGAAIGSMIAPGIGTLIGGALGGLAGSFGGETIARWIQGIDFSAIGEKAREARDEAIAWLKRLPGDAAEQLGYMVGRAVGELQQLPSEFGAWFSRSYQNAIEWISGLPDAVGNFLASIPDRVIGSIGRMWDAFVEWGRSIPGAIMEGFNSALDKLGGVGRWVVDQVSRGLSGLQELGGRFAKGFERGKVAAHAIGGIFDRPHIGLFAEDGAEAVIPLEKHRSRALAIWAEAGRILGVKAYAEGGFTGNAAPRTAASASVHATYNPNIQINVYGGSGGSSELASTIKRELERLSPQLMEDFFEMLALKMGLKTG